MNWIPKTFDMNKEDLWSGVGNLIDRFDLSMEEKQIFKLELEALLQKRDSKIESTLNEEIKARDRIFVNELNKENNYNKNARPTVIYAGLGLMIFNYAIIPSIQFLLDKAIKPFTLPLEFFIAWSGVVMTYVIGKSYEKRDEIKKS